MSELKISPELLQISPEVQDALKNKKPVAGCVHVIVKHPASIQKLTKLIIAVV